MPDKRRLWAAKVEVGFVVELDEEPDTYNVAKFAWEELANGVGDVVAREVRSVDDIPIPWRESGGRYSWAPPVWNADDDLTAEEWLDRHGTTEAPDA